MTNTSDLFFQLIRVAIGTQESLSRLPSEREWSKLFKMAEKQSLVGVCFAGLKRLGADADEGFARIGISKMLYLTWMGMTVQIQQKNETVNQQCITLQNRLSACGLRSSILKGQGVASIYSEHLHGLRQSGDIDVYVDCGMDKAMQYSRTTCGQGNYDYINAHLSIFDDTKVELHWRVGYMANLFMNKKLQNWVKVNEEKIFGGKACLPSGEITVPASEFNAFYILLHAYNHVNSEGLGLRQLMDYYFVLQSVDIERKESVIALFEQFRIKKFASGAMWIMKEVFGMPEHMLIGDSNESEGRFLLNEVMKGGNFGHHDKRLKKIGKGKMVSVMNEMQHSMSIASHYPSAVFWRPIWIVYHFLWKRMTRK